MNFIKGLVSFSPQKKLVKTTQNYELFSFTENNVNYSLFKYKTPENSINTIKVLKTLKHPNIISIIKTNKNNTKFTTEELFSVQDFYKESPVFNFYSLCVLSEVLLFLKRCNLTHNNLGFSCLFYTANCKVVVGNFENASKSKNDQTDDYMFSKMYEKFKKDFHNKDKTEQSNIRYKIQRITYKKETQYKEDIHKIVFNDNDLVLADVFKSDFDGFEEFYETNKFLYEESIYKKFENFVMKFKVCTEQEKTNYIDFIMINKKNWIEFNKIKAIDMYIDDLGTENELYKDKILYMILFLELKNYDKHINLLFCIPDSQIRTFLTANIEHYITKVTNWNDKIYNSLCLGIKCSDTQLKYNSIVFFNRICKNISDKNLRDLLKIIYTNVKDNKSVEEALMLIKNNYDRISSIVILQDEVYRMLIAFLSYSETRNITLSTLSKFYKLFDLKKLQLEMIPVLCTLLADKNNQDLCFDLTERILQHLKNNKEKLCVENWSVKNLGKMMNKISFKVPSFRKSKEKASTQNDNSNVNENELENNGEWENEW